MNLFPLSIVTILTLLATSACNKHIKPKMQDTIKIQKLVSLNKSSCFGKCPVYKITLYNDGLAILESKVNMDKLGVFHTMLAPEQLKKIISKIEKVNWPDSKSRFMKNIPDLPISTLDFFRADSLIQRIESNSSLPQDLETIHTELSDLANQKNWILALKEKEINSKDAIKNELQIDMDSSLQYIILEKLFQSYDFKMNSRISEYMNFYLFTYDTRKISAAEMVVLARRVKGVRLVSFNKKLQIREE